MRLRTRIIRRTLFVAGLAGVMGFAVFAQNAGAQNAKKTTGPGAAVVVRGSVRSTI